ADKIGELSDVAAGTSSSKNLTFTPGTYVAFCNIVDNMTSDTTMMESPTTMMTDTTMMSPTTMMSSTTMMDTPTSMMTTTTMMGSSTTMMESGGHVHFARKMYLVFVVK